MGKQKPPNLQGNRKHEVPDGVNRGLWGQTAMKKQLLNLIMTRFPHLR